MLLFKIILLNFISYILFYKISFLITKKYIYPFRLADLINFFFNILIFLYVSNIYFTLKVSFIILFININLFYISFSIINLINTSPRIKILMEISKKGKISIKNFNNHYNYNTILNNRLTRLVSSNQIVIKNSKVNLTNNKINLFKIIILIMNLMKKI